MEATIWDTYFRLGQQAFEAGDLAQAEQCFSAAVSNCEEEQLSGSQMALSLNNLAAVYHRIGDLGSAIGASERALAVRSQDPQEMAVGLLNLAELYCLTGQFAQAEAALLSAGEKLPSGDEQKAHQLERLAEVYLAVEKLPQAAEAYAQLVEVLVPGEPDQSEEIARVQHVLSNLYEALGEFDHADQSRQQCLQRLRRLWIEERSALAQVLVNMAESLAASQRPTFAIPLVEEALGYLQGPERDGVEWMWIALLRDSGQWERALQVCQARSDGASLRNLSEQGLCYFHGQQFEGALNCFEQALLASSDGDSGQRISLLYNLAAAQQGAGRDQEALGHYASALALAQEHLPPGHGLTARIVWNYTGLLEQQGEATRAQEMRQQFGASM